MEHVPDAPSTSSGGQQDREFRVALVGAAVAVTIWGSASVVVKHIDMAGLSLASYRFGIYAVGLVVWLRLRGTTIDLRVLRLSALGGIALALDVALFFTAVKRTTVVNATVIGALQPLVVAAVAWRYFGERIQRREQVLGGVALTGAIVVVVASSGGAESDLLGDLMAVGALLAWSAYFIFSKSSREQLTPGEFTAGTALWATAVNAPLALAFGQDLSWPNTSNLGWLLLLSFGAGIGGHSMMNWSLVRIPLWLGSTFTLLIPVSAAALAWVFLGEETKLVQMLAMAAVLGALGLLIRGQTTSNVRARRRP